MTGLIKERDALQLMVKHINCCKRPECEACLLAIELRATMRLKAEQIEKNEEAERRWLMLEAHEQLKAADYIKWEEECARLSAENDDLRRRLDGVRYWLDMKDTITEDR